MESWRKVWREGLEPLLSIESLVALRKGLVEDDPRLVQGATTVPPPLQCVSEWPVEGACLLGYCGLADGMETVGEVAEYFGRMAFAIDQRLNEPAGCRHLLNAYDDWTREEMRANLFQEVELALANRFAKGVV